MVSISGALALPCLACPRRIIVADRPTDWPTPLCPYITYSLSHPVQYFVAMNYTVHAVMYTYYFLMEMKLWPKWLK